MKFTFDDNELFAKLIESYNVFVFDLDNTLYDENEYLFAAYQKIGEYLEKKYPHVNPESWLFFQNTFLKEGRQKLFDKAITHFNLPDEEKQNFLQILRTISVPVGIPLFEGIDKMFSELRKKGKLIFVLTNGNPQQQRNKIESIIWPEKNLDIFFYYADELEPKPSPEGLRRIMYEHKISSEELIFIGDSDSDEQCAINAGVEYLPIQKLISSKSSNE